MKKNLTAGLLLFLMALPWLAFSQETTLTGTVKDQEGKPVEVAMVGIKNTSTHTYTNAEGKFSLRYGANAVLVVSAIGYDKTEIVLTNQRTLDIMLTGGNSTLDELVVVGYGTQRKGDVTSSVASVKSEDFLKGTVRDAAQLIQGKVAGLRVTTPSGDPNATTQINLRGLNSINGSQNPLVIVDGVPGNITTVAPEDIESIDVLKDGSAAAIYGTRATGGVILITTRKNKNPDTRSTVQYNTYVNRQQIFRKPEMMDASDYRRLISKGYAYEDLGGNTNWVDEVLQNPVSQNHNLALFGGNYKTNFTASLNYRDWEGIMLKTGQQRVSLRADLNHEMFDGKVKTNIQIINTSTKSDQGGAGGWAWRQAMIRNPTDVIQNANGTWKESNAYMYDNPLGIIHETVNDNRNKETRFSGSVDYRPLKDLSFKMMASRVQTDNIYGNSTTFRHVNTTKNNLNGTANRATGAGTENLLELTTNYMKTFDRHRVTLLGGYSWQDYTGESFNVYNFDFPTDAYSYNRIEAGTALQRGLATMNSYKSKWQLAGFFARVNYSFNDKYLLMASVRREGSSTFGENNQWGTFPAFSLGWNIANEDFLKSNTTISQLKLRAGVGVTGTIASSPYQSQISYNFAQSQGAFIGGKWVPGFIPARNFNPDLRWEKKTEWNVGIDFGILKNRISGSVDYYTRIVNDLLYNFSVPVPPYLINNMMLNAGSMENSGLEVLLNIDAVRNTSVRWNTNLTFSTNKNRLLNLSNEQFKATSPFFDPGHTGEPIQVSTHRVQVERPIGQFFVLKSVGVDENGKWLVENQKGETIPIAQATPTDRQFYGNGIPKFLLGWNNSLNYQRFDLTVNFRGAFGHNILNMQRLYYENPVNKAYNVLKTAYDPVYGKELKNDLVYVSHYIEKGDYLKLDNLTLGYTLPAKTIKGISNLRIYGSVLNVLTFTGYKGIDPEGVSYTGDYTFAPGIDHRDKYPNTRTYTLGLNVSF